MKRLEVYGELVKSTLWVGKEQWKNFGIVVGNGSRADMIRHFIDRTIAKNTDKLEKGKKKK